MKLATLEKMCARLPWAVGALAILLVIATLGSALQQARSQAGGYPLTTSQLTGAETAVVQFGSSPLINTVTLNQIAQFGRQQSGSAGIVNSLVGGDFGINPWQRGTTFTAIANTLTYTADRFWALGGASSSISVSKQTGASDIVSRYAASLRFGRADSNADTTAICFGQVLESANSTRFQNHGAIFSGQILSAAGFSAASRNITVTIAYGTGADESAASFAAGTWTGYTAATASTVTLTTSFARYQVATTIPVTATQVGLKICYTPVGTASGDYLEATGLQLEVNDSGFASAFEHEPVSIMLERAQRYYWRISEGATTVAYANGQATTTTVAKYIVQNPVPMRIAPTTTVTTGTFASTKADGTAASTCTVTATASSNTVNYAGLTDTCGAASFTAGNASQLVGGGGTGVLQFSAEL